MAVPDYSNTVNTLLLWLVISCAISWVLTYLLRRFALYKNLLDIPNNRSSHTVPMPRGGGLAIVLTFSLGLVVLYISGGLSIRHLSGFLGAGGIVALIGFIDDRAHVSPLWRLLTHMCAAIWGVTSIGTISSFTLFGHTLELHWLGYALSVVILVWSLNLYNFMDGIDGIAASEAIFIADSGLLFATLAGNTSLQIVAILLIGATAGFLFWNWPPAKIFMGDVGSGFLGIVLGMFAYLTAKDGIVSFWAWLIIFGAFWIDATLTLLRRIFNGLTWYEAHRTHAYQHAAIKWGHLRVTAMLSVINILWLLPIAYLANIHRAWGGELALLALLPLAVIGILLKAGQDRN